MKLLVIEDSLRLRKALKRGLEQEGCSVDLAVDGEEGVQFAELYGYDVIVLDLMMPRLDGGGVIRQLRASGNNTHILVLSAKDQLQDRVEVLDMGADDYLVKPFAFEELLSRIRALNRRQYGNKSSLLSAGDLQVDTVSKHVSHKGQQITLSPYEYRCLAYLLMHRGQVISRMQIIDHLHHADDEIESNVVEALIYSLRKKLKPFAANNLIQTKRGYGYFIA